MEDKKTQEENEVTDVTFSAPSGVLPDVIPDKYPNVPKDVLEDLKKEHSIIFGTYFNGNPALYKVFSVSEYLKYQEDFIDATNKLREENAKMDTEKQLSDAELGEILSAKADELLVDQFTVYPEGIVQKVESGEYPGGAIYTLTQAILTNNGFVDLEPMFLSKKEVDADPEIISVLDEEILVDTPDLNSDDIVQLLEQFNEVVLFWFLNQLYIVRGFKYDEYSDIRKLSASLDSVRLSIELVQQFTVYPKELDIEEIPAGLVIKGLADAILLMSGFTSAEPDIVIME
jgi:hypothetical protein